MDIINRAETEPFTTKDGSTIRELMAYRNSVVKNQSLAEAMVPPGVTTIRHKHLKSEEIYYFLQGSGQMELEGKWRKVGPGDAVAIPPGSPHQLRNNGPDDLVLLCCCAPAYEHEDTILLDKSPGHPPE